MKLIIVSITLLLSTNLLLFGQNWAVQMWSSVTDTNDPYLALGGPTNWAAGWKKIGTNTTVSPPFVFVGDDFDRALFIAARIGAYQNWTNTVWRLQAPDVGELAVSNKTFQTAMNIIITRNLITNNLAFLAGVQTNRPQNLITLSNQTVVISRLLNQMTPLLREFYEERQNKNPD